jgi:sugar/nucleoside kinase (ribokinase family)
VGREAFLEWTSGAELVFPNLDEGRLLTGRDEPDAIVAALLESYPVVALKLGAAGAIAAAADGRRVRVAARPTEVVDSTGAGDAFCAGFLTRWLRGGDLEECALCAVTAAARATAQVGGRPRRD